ncbi:MAG TPA: prepilin-type N-terminal cleavage/methylation domain-containing protein [Candidatus Rifleibacterium sp.]|nr:prepilin-type N-terminal cleavage/methylation domain-containing protein [Candidatus Rifleibacterium sp.]HPT45411.1 prepilin-type N-terminal cleavage/methylation domain-containing protein [Candidatus Rifleibacterium sp.]
MTSKKPLKSTATEKLCWLQSGFTITEVLIASGVLSIFLAALFSLYSGGTRMSSQTMWTQNIINQLKLASRQINTSIKRSSYPSSLTFPGNIVENEKSDFALHYYDGQLHATESATLTSSTYGGSKFLAVTESTPAKSGYDASDNADATLIYHIFSLTDEGLLNYARFKEKVGAASIGSLARTAIPPGGADGVYRTILARDVESVLCQPTSAAADCPLSVRINCRIPRGHTTRSETAIGTANVAKVSHKSTGGW